MQNKITSNLMLRYATAYKKARVKTLIFDNYEDPFMVFRDFFSSSDIENHLAMLKRMYKHASVNRRFKKHPADIVLYYEIFTNLLNATWIIFKTNIRFKDLEAKEKYLGIGTGGELSNESLTKYLAEGEIEDAYRGFYNAFAHISLTEYHRRLNNWYKLSLCGDDHDDEDKLGRKIYKMLKKLMVCSWLIYEREILQSEAVLVKP
ncbi:hypothetical protein [Pedobacter sp. UBA4863]|uniref:hypothetical protein n=1 Tax=Pedobacter sp. UBA4863 TaxID=1947060 RepID=UPI0025E985F4|nr:hypothetical protein [Pedobacter sp. UBA4863]